MDGTKTKPIIFLHGWGGRASSWNKNVKYFRNKGYDCHAVKLPGFGLMDPVLWGIPEYADYVTDEIKTKFPRKKCVLVGHSFGGRIAIYITSQHPELVDTLIMSDSAGLNLEPKVLRRMLILMSKYFGALEQRFSTLSSLRDLAIKLLGSKDYKKANPKMRVVMKKVVNLDLGSLLPSIKCKTLIVWGEKDSVTPLSIALAFKKGVKNSKLKVVKEAEHHTQQTHAEEWNYIVEEFIKSTG